MKRIILVASCFVLLATVVEAKRVRVTKTGGGENGYYSTKESHGPLVSTLNCTDPGYEKCKFTVNPLTNWTTIINAIEGQIASGTFTGGDIIGGAVCSWTGSDPFNVIIDVEIEGE